MKKVETSVDTPSEDLARGVACGTWVSACRILALLLTPSLAGCVGGVSPVKPVKPAKQLSLTASPITIMTPTLPDGAQGMNYGVTLVATGGRPPYHWSSGGTQLEAIGLVIDPTNGSLTGIPFRSGHFSFVANAKDVTGSYGSAILSINITAVPIPTTPAVSTSNGPVAQPAPTTVPNPTTSTVSPTNGPVAEPVPTIGRDWRHWPFSPASPWNQPIGSEAQYSSVPGLASTPASLNYNGVWTSSVVIATDNDPFVRILFNPPTGPQSNWAFFASGGKACSNSPTEDIRLESSASNVLPFAANYYSTLATPNTDIWILPTNFESAFKNYQATVRLPASACPSPDTDALMAVFQPNGMVLDAYNAVVESNGAIIASMASYVDAKGDGTGVSNGRRASMVPSFAGLIRTGEISSGHIPHALAAMATQRLLQAVAVWPAAAFDRSSHYTGLLPMGSLLAIPATVDLTKLGLSKQGMVIAKAAQDYGVYIVDSNSGNGLTFLAEFGDPEIRWDGTGNSPPWWWDIQAIACNLQRVINNTPATPGGGGATRAPLAPPF